MWHALTAEPGNELVRDAAVQWIVDRVENKMAAEAAAAAADAQTWTGLAGYTVDHILNCQLVMSIQELFDKTNLPPALPATATDPSPLSDA